MSRYLKTAFQALAPYVPGEQPRDQKYIKLNTNESPFPPSAGVQDAVLEASKSLRLYSDPESTDLRARAARFYGIDPDEILMTNGSDEALNFAFMAYGDDEHPFLFPDITYGFYQVLCRANRIPYQTVPLQKDFTICADDYIGQKGTVVLANPNAPTGIALQTGEIQRILAADPERVVIVDEAYADFSDDNCLGLIGSCPNLLIVRTFSKSWSLAGARLGCAIGNKDLIADLNRVKNAINPYNVNRMTAAAGMAAMDDKAYHDRCCQEICMQRERTAEALKKLGFTVLPSGTNFLFAKSADICGRDLYIRLKQRGILVRHFAQEGISDFVRITIGTAEDMDRLLEAIECIEQEAKDA